MDKKITAISLIALLTGLFSELAAIVEFTPYKWLLTIITIVKQFSPNINLSFFFSRSFIYINFNTSLSLHYIDLAIYLLLIIGLIVFIKTKGEETRLLQLIFSTIFLQKILSLTYGIVLFFVSGPEYLSKTNIILSITSYITSFSWLFLAYYVILKLSKKNKNVISSNDDISRIHESVDTPKLQRLLHQIIDIILSIAICSRLCSILLKDIVKQVIVIFDERTAMYLIVISSHFIYLIFFEYLFQATPAKLFTGSKVIMTNGTKPSIKTIFLRTLIRHIPFETFSFLGKGSGWHDTLTNTKVVKVKTERIPLKRYGWILIGFLLVAVLSFVGYNLKEKYNEYQWEKRRYLNRIEKIENAQKNLNTDIFFEINNAKDTWLSGRDTYYLKVDSIKKETVVFRYFKSSKYKPIVYWLEKYYEKNKSHIQQIELSKETLRNGYIKDFSDFRNSKRAEMIVFPKSAKRYYLSNAFCGYKPEIKLSSSSSCGNNTIEIGLRNNGWPAKIIEIKNLKGNLSWQNQLPLNVPTKSEYATSSASLSAQNFETGKLYKFEFTISDSLNNKQTYVVEGVNLEKTITKKQ